MHDYRRLCRDEAIFAVFSLGFAVAGYFLEKQGLPYGTIGGAAYTFILTTGFGVSSFRNYRRYISSIRDQPEI